MQTARKIAITGDLTIVHIKKPRPAVDVPPHGFYTHGLPADLRWRYRVRSRWFELTLRIRLCVKGFWRGLTQASGVIGVGRLYATHIRRDGTLEHLGLVSTKYVTNAGVALLVDDMDNNAQDISNFNYHACGTGTNAENVADTALQTESTAVLNPNNTRATGVRSQPAANQDRSVKATGRSDPPRIRSATRSRRGRR